MAERKGPEGEPTGRDPVESGRHEDRSRGADERDLTPAEGSADEGTELIDNHRDSDSAESETTESDTASVETGGADVLDFRPRPADGSDELVDFDDFGEELIDLSALQADDALLDVLGGTNPDVAAQADERPSLEALLVAWRQDIDAAPIGDLVDVETAASAIEAGNRPRRRLKRRHLVPVATAAAVLMITFTGVGVAARDAQPGDMLWGVAQVLYTDHTRAVVAASSARDELNTAEGAIEQGNRTVAEAALRSAQEQMRGVDDEHGLSDLRAAHASLTARMDHEHEQPSQQPTSETPPTPSTSPSPSQPLPPPPVQPTDSSSQPPSSSTPPLSSTSPSETSGSSEHPSSGSGSDVLPEKSTSNP
ncbi:anti-sigma-D factor RsdA [Saccharopolyspora spinosa]|uniref:Anti-sigma-D factor RsdA-like protein n=1 Tax=Saccharopolyspora spinosa TaxID=60894 RepID=A0A2N3XQ50_SACSN|nr:anti-sigma-D factor RsdA [Saccharopolyspora spinosa]PKW12807.1 anti-sigma-D factor RsdA-like protein [Saccharopolyspora spinosa]